MLEQFHTTVTMTWQGGGVPQEWSYAAAHENNVQEEGPDRVR